MCKGNRPYLPRYLTLCLVRCDLCFRAVRRLVFNVKHIIQTFLIERKTQDLAVGCSQCWPSKALVCATTRLCMSKPKQSEPPGRPFSRASTSFFAGFVIALGIGGA